MAIAALWSWWSKRLLPVWLALLRQACLPTAWVRWLAGVAISAVVKAIAILAVSGIVGLVVSFGLCKVLRVEEFAVLSRIGSKFAGKLGRGKRGKHVA